ncbi:unnamed protein product [Withania somnifera]
MATVAAEMMLQCRRPYHKNCSCSLHKQKGENPRTCVHSRNISFPKWQNRKDMTLSIAASQFSSPSSSCINSPVVSVHHKRQL